LVTAVNEVVANALQHGTPPVGLWMWRDGDDVLCEVGDNGLWHPPPSPLTGFIPPDTALQRGFGLWTVRLLVDLMDVRAGWDGTSGALTGARTDWHGGPRGRSARATRPASARKPLPRWRMASFSAGTISAAGRVSPSGTKIGP